MVTNEPPGIGDVEELTLERGYCTEAVVEALRDVLSSTTCQLISLRIQACPRLDHHGQHLFAGLLSSNCRLEELDLTENNIGDTGAIQLARILSLRSSVLRKLVLTKNIVGDSGVAAALCEQAAHRATLTHLGLTKNRISDPGVRNLIKAVADHTALTYWSVDQNALTSLGFYNLVEAIPSFACLKTLTLGPFTCLLNAQHKQALLSELKQEQRRKVSHNVDGVDGPENRIRQIENILQGQNPPTGHDPRLIMLLQKIAAETEDN